MKRLSNIAHSTALIALSFSVGAMTIAPSTSFALTSTSSAFCTNLPTRANTITANLSALNAKVTQAWATQDQKIASNEKSVDQEVATDRQQADSERSTDFTQLEAKATTDMQKQAVKTYEATVLSAVTARRNAYDAARASFRTGLTQAVSTRRATVSAQLTTFINTATDALNAAEAACTANPSQGPSIRTTLVANLKAARATFQTERKDDATVGTQVKELAATRTAAFKTADQVFSASMTSARQALKQAFRGSSVSV